MHCSWKLKIIIIFYFTFTLLFLFFILSYFHSPFSVSLSSLPLHLFFLPPQTYRPFFLPRRPIADLHNPNRHRPIAADPRSAADLTHFSLSSLFSAFRFCVLSCACVSALCFGLWLCFGLGFSFQLISYLIFHSLMISQKSIRYCKIRKLIINWRRKIWIQKKK